MIEIKMMKYQFGRTSEEAVQAMLEDRWQIKHDAIVIDQEDGRTFYAVVWQRMTPEFVERVGEGMLEGIAFCKQCGVESVAAGGLCGDCLALEIETLTEGMELVLADGEKVTVSGITMKDGEVHRVKVTKPHPANDTNITTTMKLDTLIDKLPEAHPWHDTPPPADE